MVDLARGLIRYTAIPIAASSVAGTAVGLATSARFGFLASFMTLAISILLLNALTNAKPGRD
jgi:hypothetical protein